MCQEVLKMVQGMEQKNIEIKLALQCAPLITGIKISNLLIVSKSDAESMPYILRKTGLVFFKLTEMKDKVTFLVFRRQELASYLEDSRVKKMLRENGYEDLSLKGILYTFMRHYQSYVNEDAQFPHEMGLLLGYPIEDVEVFIVHNGKNFLYSGYWKVYADVPAKQKLFRQYEEAQRDVISLLAKGMEIRCIIKKYQNSSEQILLAV